MRSSPCSRAEAARNALGDGRLRPSALSFVGGDHPDLSSSSLRAEDEQEPAAPPTGLLPRADKGRHSRDLLTYPSEKVSVDTSLHSYEIWQHERQYAK